MKQNIVNTLGAFLFAATLITGINTQAQTVETKTTTITSEGLISEFDVDRIIIKTNPSAEPLSYSSTKTTTYLDEKGSPVAINTVRTGLPVTIYYTKVGDGLVASKVVVRTAATIAPTNPLQTTAQSSGVITAFGSDRFTIKSELTPEFFTFIHTRETQFVDENNMGVSLQAVMPGIHVTVNSIGTGSMLTAVKVIVRNAPAVAVEERKTTTTTTTTK